MEYYRVGKTLVPEGGIFGDISDALEFAKEAEAGEIQERLQDVTFLVDEEGFLRVLLEKDSFFISLSALKDFCKMLKVPASYINKFPARKLVLENLNNNPYLSENSDRVKFVLWNSRDEEPEKVIVGVLPVTDNSLPVTDFLEAMEADGVFGRENTQAEEIAITGEGVTLYFYLPQELTSNGITIHLGYSMHYSSSRMQDFVISPFCKVEIVAANGEPFDFDFQGKTKLHVAKRKSPDFLSETIDLACHYIGRDLGEFYQEAEKFALAAKNTGEIKFSLLKFLKAKAVSTYNYGGSRVESSDVIPEVIPEYREFCKANEEVIKVEPSYVSNNLPVNFYFPVFFNRFYSFPPNIESADFFVRYRKSIGLCLLKLMDEVGDIVVYIK